MNSNKLSVEESKQLIDQWAEFDCDTVNFDDLEEKLESELEEKTADLINLEIDREKIGNPDSIQETILNVVYEQINNQIGVQRGNDFINKNKGLNLDLRKGSHIQTGFNFQKAAELDGKIGTLENKIKAGNATPQDRLNLLRLKFDRSDLIASHNKDIDFEKRFVEWQDKFKHDENGNLIQHETRTGQLEATLADGARKDFDKHRPSGSKERKTNMDHIISAGENIRDPEANAHLTREEQINFLNSDANLNEMDASQNISKGDKSMTDWLDNPNKRGQKPNEIFDISEEQDKQYREKDKKAREKYEKTKKEGEQRSIETGETSK